MCESCPELQHDLGSLGFAGCYVGGCVGDQCLASKFQHLRGCLVCLENIWNFKCLGRVGKVINDDKLALYGAQLNTYLEWFVMAIKFSADSLVPSAGARRVTSVQRFALLADVRGNKACSNYTILPICKSLSCISFTSMHLCPVRHVSWEFWWPLSVVQRYCN